MCLKDLVLMKLLKSWNIVWHYVYDSYIEERRLIFILVNYFWFMAGGWFLWSSNFSSQATIHYITRISDCQRAVLKHQGTYARICAVHTTFKIDFGEHINHAVTQNLANVCNNFDYCCQHRSTTDTSHAQKFFKMTIQHLEGSQRDSSQEKCHVCDSLVWH